VTSLNKSCHRNVTVVKNILTEVFSGSVVYIMLGILKYLHSIFPQFHQHIYIYIYCIYYVFIYPVYAVFPKLCAATHWCAAEEAEVCHECFMF